MIDPNFEERDPMYQLHEIASYYKTYTTSLEKQLKEKDEVIKKLTVDLQQTEDKIRRAKGDLKSFKKDLYVTGLLDKIKKLERDNEALLCKVTAQK